LAQLHVAAERIVKQTEAEEERSERLQKQVEAEEQRREQARKQAGRGAVINPRFPAPQRRANAVRRRDTA
jgi:hypothetical protein